MRQNGVDPGTRTSNRTVDPLLRQQKGPFDRMRAAQVQERRAQGGVISETGEVVEGSDRLHARGLNLTAQSRKGSD